jgi:hypothetical protein
LCAIAGSLAAGYLWAVAVAKGVPGLKGTAALNGSELIPRRQRRPARRARVVSGFSRSTVSDEQHAQPRPIAADEFEVTAERVGREERGVTEETNTSPLKTAATNLTARPIRDTLLGWFGGMWCDNAQVRTCDLVRTLAHKYGSEDCANAAGGVVRRGWQLDRQEDSLRIGEM